MIQLSMKKIKIGFGNKEFEIEAKEVSAVGKITGLMFRTKNTKNLLFDFKKQSSMAIHSFFVFFPFLGIWLDNKNSVVEYKVINPFTFKVKPKKPFSRLLEIPLNDKNKSLINFIVG